MPVKVYDGTNWVTVAGDGAAGAPGSPGTSSSIATWVKTASGGETSVSGTGDTGYGTLAYTVGQELVYLNGVLLDRGDDYTATTGTSITGLTALAANDIITVWTVNSFSVANTYTQAQANAAFAPISVTGGMTLLNAGGTAMSGASTSVSIDSTGYTALEIFVKDAYSNTNDSGAFMRINGDSGSNYGYSAIRWDGGPSVTGVQQNATTYFYYLFNNIPSNNTTLLKGNSQITLFQPTATSNHSVHWQSISGQNNGLQSSTVGGGTYDASAAVTSISIHCGGSATWSGGTIYVYGVK
jgi:hypothetical protein